jgi:hypothetical protein
VALACVVRASAQANALSKCIEMVRLISPRQPPLAVIALSLGGALAGVLGALIGVPTAALVALILDEYVVRKETTPAEFATSDA